MVDLAERVRAWLATGARLSVRPHPTPAAPRQSVGPDFLCIGAQKAGTRWLFDQLDHHPDFWMPPIKELHYFDGPRAGIRRARAFYEKATTNLVALNRKRARRNLPPLDQRSVDFLAGYLQLPWPKVDLDRYGKLFTAKGEQISGDITPDYSVLDPHVIQRIAQSFPEVRIVYLARDPVERTWSDICQAVRQKEGGVFNDATIARYLRSSSVAHRSASSVIVRRWRRFMDPQRLGVFFFDCLRTDPAGLRAQIITFLGGDPVKPSGGLAPDYNRKRNATKIPLSDDIRERLITLCRRELRAGGVELGGLALEWCRKYGV